MEITKSITTFTTYGFATVPAKVWAFRQMGLAGEVLSQTRGLKFWKMLGSGKGAGFSLSPNWSRYALLCEWEDEDAANAFATHSVLSADFRAYAYEQWSVQLAVTRSQGTWDGQNLFTSAQARCENYEGPIAVLTRGSINWNRLYRFWRHVPMSSRAIEKAPGVLASIGIGELPLVRQATLSFWESAEHMKEFAYHSPIHKEIVRKTRRENWYKEDLFARFVPIRAEGKWNGRNPLAGLSSKQNNAQAN